MRWVTLKVWHAWEHKPEVTECISMGQVAHLYRSLILQSNHHAWPESLRLLREQNMLIYHTSLYVCAQLMCRWLLSMWNVARMQMHAVQMCQVWMWKQEIAYLKASRWSMLLIRSWRDIWAWSREGKWRAGGPKYISSFTWICYSLDNINTKTIKVPAIKP